MIASATLDSLVFAGGVSVPTVLKNAFGVLYGQYGATQLETIDGGDSDTALFSGLPGTLSVWMSHGDAVTAAPPGFQVTARTTVTPVAAFEDRARRLAGVQFHPEVRHCERGQDVLEHFLFDIAGLTPGWDTACIVA